MSNNNRKLKIGFAMGGGVSLGSFSGAGLSEAIRQIVLYGGYKSVEIDIFAGASAGSMSLAIMLRGLAYQTKAEKSRAERTLRKELGNERFDAMSAEMQKDIIAAQVVQDLQYDIWVKEINIYKLLGIDQNSGDEMDDLTFEAGLVRRQALSDIAAKFFDFKLEEEGQVDFTSRRLLGKRVLFGSTLTNLSPLKIDSRRTTQHSDPNYTSSSDAFTSLTHREVRIFDLNFEKLSPGEVADPLTYPQKWIRYHTGTKQTGSFGDLNSKAPWSKIVSTSMACGAFPFAFEPVVLKRHDYEFGKEWPKELNDLGFVSESGNSQWYPFSYVDGGTMNNEPVREAFRLASFQDAGDTSEFDRVIIFVDPFLGDDKVDYRIAIHKRYGLDKHPEQLPTLPRLRSHVGDMLSVLTEQVRNNENDKIYDTLELFRDRKMYCQPLFEMIGQLPEPIVDRQMETMRAKIVEILENERQNELLPVGAITLREELILIRKEHLDHLDAITVEDITNYCDQTGTFPLNKKRTFLKAFYAILVTIITGLAGKSSENKIVAIAPVRRDDAGNETPIYLPGSYLAAFSGFFSETPNDFAVRLAKYCARDFMKRSQLIPSDAPGEIAYPEFTAEEQSQYEDDFAKRLKYLKQRIANVIAGDRPVLEAVLTLALKHINTAIDNIQLKRDPVEKINIHVPVTEDDFMFAGEHKSKAILVDGVLTCITEATLHLDSNVWEGQHVQPSRDLLIRKDNLLQDPDICRIALPEKELVKKARLYPNPIFTLKNPVTVHDQGKNIKSSAWIISPGVKPLEDTLLC